MNQRTRVIMVQDGNQPSKRITRVAFRAVCEANGIAPESKATIAKMQMRNDGLAIGTATYYFGFAQPDIRDVKTGRFTREAVTSRANDFGTLVNNGEIPATVFIGTIPQSENDWLKERFMNSQPSITFDWKTIAVAFLLAILIPCGLLPLMLDPAGSSPLIAGVSFAAMGIYIPYRARNIDISTRRLTNEAI